MYQKCHIFGQQIINLSCEWVEVPHDDDHEDTDDESSLNVKSLKDLGLTYT